MEFSLILVIIVSVVFIAFYKSRRAKKTSATENAPVKESNNFEDDYFNWVSVLKERNPNIKKFDLFGTKAAILWKSGAREVEVVCLTAFSKGVPSTKKYEYFSFNIHEWYWSGVQPRGCATQIKEQLKIVQAEIT